MPRSRFTTNATFWEVGRVANDEVAEQSLISKYIPVLMYGVAVNQVTAVVLRLRRQSLLYKTLELAALKL